SRPELLEIGDPDIDSTDVRWVRAVLRLSSWDYSVVSGSSGRSLQDLWGADPADPQWRDDLTDLQEFLRRAGIDYDALLDLEEGLFFAPCANALKRASPDDSEVDPCKLEGMLILQGTQAEVDAALFAVQNFLRLQLRLGWTTAAID